MKTEPPSNFARVMLLSRQQVTQFFLAMRLISGTGASVQTRENPFIVRR